MTPDSDAYGWSISEAEQAWDSPTGPHMALTEADRPGYIVGYEAGRQSVLDDHPVVLRAAADRIKPVSADPYVISRSEDAQGYLRWLADRLEQSKVMADQEEEKG